MHHSSHRGHPVVFIDPQLYYTDTIELTRLQCRPCGVRGKFNSKQGHDACISSIPGILNACCGHGEEKSAYVQFSDRFCWYGKKAADLLARYKNNAF